jgi:O-antigen/teichoic acid export membrane protein
MMNDRLAPRLLRKMPAGVTRRGGDPAAVARGLLSAWRNRGPEDGQALPALLNSVALVCGRMSTMALGFLSWMLAARLYAAAEVGLASGAISAMMLCVQLGLFGIGPAVIALFPQHQRGPTQLLNTAFSIVCGATLVAAVLFLALASAAFHELSVLGHIPLYALLFVAMTLFGTVGVLFDHISITLRRGDQVLTRNVLNGVVTLGLVALLPLVTGRASSFTIFAAWVAGNLSCCVLGFVQLGRALPGYHYRPNLRLPLARQLLGVGLPNWALTLTERAPGPIMPVVVTELLSPVANARWYAVWMISWVVFIVPISVGQTLFAAAARQTGGLRAEVLRSIRSSLGLGCVMAAGVVVTAPLMLWFLGHGYVAAGVTPLRILVVGVLPLTLIQAYFAVCRARRNLLEAILTGMASGLCAIVGTAAAGVYYGLTGMALAWLAVQVATALWALWRLRALTQWHPVASAAERTAERTVMAVGERLHDRAPVLAHNPDG